MKIYIAGYFDTRKELHPVRARMVELGHTCLSDWLDEPDWTGEGVVGSKQSALDDLDAVEKCDLFIQDTHHVSPRGGAMVEYGYAQGLNKRTWLVGPQRNLFHRLVSREFANWDEALKALKELSR